MRSLMSKMLENKDYELIPSSSDSTVWHVRILSGDFTETIVKFGSISFNEVKDHFSFNFDIIETPDSSLHISNEDLQFTAARILEDIIERGEKEGWVKAKERKTLGQDDTIN